MSPKQRIILGIDFGTTYSGVAWADSTNPREISCIRQWPDAVGMQDMDKVPSEMVYESDGTFRWGFQACTDDTRRNGNVLQYVKLLLDPSQGKQSVLPDPLGLARNLGKLPENMTPVDVVADYLRGIKLHALQVLSNQYGTEFWKVIDLEYHLTIPAVWSESAKALTLKAANQAGIGTSQDLVLIAEPEAAALYCLTDLNSGLLKAGDTFVVVDCGGGTVDLVSYKILQREPKLEVKEVAVGGGLCGSVFLNRRFEVFMRRRLGDATIEKMLQKSKPYWRMMNEFDEKLKRKFKASKDQAVMDCPVAGVQDDPSRRVEDGFMEIDREEMQDIFDPVIDEIFHLIHEQLDSVVKGGHKSVSTIILVGGFGSSEYLRSRVQKNIQHKYGISNKVTVLQPANAWSAVARGAVICGLQTVTIQSRKARRNYGVRISALFDDSNEKHLTEYKIWCEKQCKYLCHSLMNWYVQKGDEVAGTTKISFPFHRTFWTNTLDDCKRISIDLYASNSERTQLETYWNHENVYEICTIHCDAAPLQKHLVPRTNSEGKSYFILKYNIVMYIHSAQLTFGIERNGVPCGTTATATFV